ncbi:hypothetical protein E2320_009256, partial [Naja naja]
MNPSFALNLAVSNVICALVFGQRFSTEDENFHHLLEAIEKIFNVSDSVVINLYNISPGLCNVFQDLTRRHFPHVALFTKVQQEIDILLTPGQSICYEDRKKLPYTNAVGTTIFPNMASAFNLMQTFNFHLADGSKDITLDP